MMNRVPEPIEVGVLGATGTVGSLLVRMLDGHPWFRLREVGASPASAGMPLGDRTPADSLGPLSMEASGLVLKALDDEWSSPLLLSALPSSAARPIEALLAERGHLVVSNASAYRQDPVVPLIIPEVNPDHLRLLEAQADRWPGGIVTNPNCVTAGLATALAPLHRAFGLETVIATSMQAISGAGRPGPAAAELTDNVIPFIADEEEKIAEESQKILGHRNPDRIVHGDFVVSAHANRVPVLHGHLVAVSASFRNGASPEDVEAAFTSFEPPEEARGLPSAPERPIELIPGNARPQPRLDRDRGQGMVVTVGRVRPCPALHVRFLVLAHNLIRGAAGAALLNAELCHAVGVTSRMLAR
jgi:aspartate-semialdehyde dehydrogenase